MATNIHILQGEVSEKPEAQEINVEALLAGFVRAMCDEVSQSVNAPTQPLLQITGEAS